MEHHPAGLIRRFKDRRSIAHQSQIVCRGNSRRPGANDRDFLPACNPGPTLLQYRKMPAPFVACILNSFAQLILRVGIHRFDAILFGHKTLERADRDWRINLSAAAGVFARRGTHAPTHRSEGIRRTRYEIGFFELTFGDELYVFARVCFDWASGLAGDHTHPEFNIRDERIVFRHTHDSSRRVDSLNIKQELLQTKRRFRRNNPPETVKGWNGNGSDLGHA